MIHRMLTGMPILKVDKRTLYLNKLSVICAQFHNMVQKDLLQHAYLLLILLLISWTKKLRSYRYLDLNATVYLGLNYHHQHILLNLFQTCLHFHHKFLSYNYNQNGIAFTDLFYLIYYWNLQSYNYFHYHTQLERDWSLLSDNTNIMPLQQHCTPEYLDYCSFPGASSGFYPTCHPTFKGWCSSGLVFCDN